MRALRDPISKLRKALETGKKGGTHALRPQPFTEQALQKTVGKIRSCDSEANPDANDEGQKQKRDGGQKQEVPFPEGPGTGDDPPATAA